MPTCRAHPSHSTPCSTSKTTPRTFDWSNAFSQVEPTSRSSSQRKGISDSTSPASTNRAVVLLDLHLPDIDGEQVLRQLRDDALTRTAPVIVLSADANHRQIQRLLEGGAAAYLTKPLDIHQLVDTVDELISERWPRPMRSEPC